MTFRPKKTKWPNRRRKTKWYSRAPMTKWYSPIRLINIGIRVAISTVFGEFADRREAMAGAREIDPTKLDPHYDYSNKDTSKSNFWLDFVADTGDGWNSTYAIARMLADPRLKVADCDSPLPRGRILIMGGDEVYPTPSDDDYKQKLIAPFDEAHKTNPWPKKSAPHVYLIPGNHDWYDGLRAFLGTFCRRRATAAWGEKRQGRPFGGRETQQTRSYFALKLPHNWWLWGVDVQIEGYVDQPQIDFFEHVAHQWMAPKSRLILCTGLPNWEYVDKSDPGKQFRTFSYVERLAGIANRGHQVRLVLSGDSHHYARYMEGDLNYITAGGGGAFLHPTHNLTDKDFTWDYPPPGVKAELNHEYPRSFKLRDPKTNAKRLFPSSATSGLLSLRTLAFAFLNWSYALTLGGACAFFAWVLDSNARAIYYFPLADYLTQKPASFYSTACAYSELVLASPWPLTLVGIAVGGYYYLADFDGWKRWVVGGLHSLAQTGSVVVATILLAICKPQLTAISPYLYGRWQLIVYVGFVGGLLSATILGTYFLFCLTFFGKHWNEAFSALRIQDYKNFVRMRIDPKGDLFVYPIGLTRVPRDSGKRLRNPPLDPHLIEPPIQIT